MQLAWAGLNDLRTIGLRVALVLAAWLAWDRWAGRPRERPTPGTKGRVLDAAAVVAAAVLAASLFILYRLDVRPSSRALLVAALVAPAAYLAPLARRRIRRRRWMLPVLVGVLALVAAGTFAGPSLRARWGPYDDHEIMRFLGSDGRVTMGEIPTLLAGTELGQPGQAVRFRPAYCSVRLIEAALWGDSPVAWYAARIGMFAVALALVGLVLARTIGLLPCALFVLYMLTLRFWGDIWCRLGPGETYAALGLALYLTGFSGLASSRAATSGGTARDWLLLTVGSLLAMGSKENFLLLALPTAGLLALSWVRGRARAIALPAAAVSLAFAAFVAACILLAVSRAGGDVYGASVAPGYRIALFREGAIRFLGAFSPWDLAAGLAVLTLALKAFAATTTSRAAARVLARAGLAVLALALLHAAQYAFYRGFQQTGMRYDFPGALAASLALLVIAVSMVALLRALRFHRRVLRGVEAGLVAGLALTVLGRDLLFLRRTCLANVERTVAFTSRLEEVSARLREHPDRLLVVTSGDAQSYEPVRGLPSFLAAQGARNALTFRFESTGADDRPLGRTLMDEMALLSRTGGDGYVPWPPSHPLRDCFGLGIGQEPRPPCVSLGTLPR